MKIYPGFLSALILLTTPSSVLGEQDFTHLFGEACGGVVSVTPRFETYPPPIQQSPRRRGGGKKKKSRGTGVYIRALEDSERVFDAARGQKLRVSEEIYCQAKKTWL